jgi:hypothetical protein
MKKKGRRRVVAKRDGGKPDHRVWRLVEEFSRGYRERSGRALRTYVEERHREVFGEDPPRRVPVALVAAAVGYELQYRGFRQHGEQRKLSTRFLTRRVASRRYVTCAYDARVRTLLRLRISGGKTMPSKKKAKKKGGGGREGSVAEHIVEILRRSKMGTNDEVVAEIQKAHPDSAFDGTHLSWYKGKFTRGELTAYQDKPETFNQPDSGRGAPGKAKGKGKSKARKGKGKATAKKKSRGRKVVKRKKSKAA